MYRGKAEALQQGTADKNKGSCQRVVTESKGGSGDKGLNATMHNNISRSISPDTAEDGNVLDECKYKQLTRGS